MMRKIEVIEYDQRWPELFENGKDAFVASIEESVIRKFRTTASDGKNYQVIHYNLDIEK